MEAGAPRHVPRPLDAGQTCRAGVAQHRLVYDALRDFTARGLHALAIETLENMANNGLLPESITFDKALKNYVKSINKGLLKVASKMGISTLQSYRGAQVFEAIGLNKSLVDKYFTGTASRIEGVGLGVLAREAQMKHEMAFRPVTESETELSVGGTRVSKLQRDAQIRRVLEQTEAAQEAQL